MLVEDDSEGLSDRLRVFAPHWRRDGSADLLELGIGEAFYEIAYTARSMPTSAASAAGKSVGGRPSG
jgi:hypothetical protein